MTPQGDRGQGGGQREGEGGGVPEVEHREQHHPTEEEGRQHQETVCLRMSISCCQAQVQVQVG